MRNLKSEKCKKRQIVCIPQPSASSIAMGISQVFGCEKSVVIPAKIVTLTLFLFPLENEVGTQCRNA